MTVDLQDKQMRSFAEIFLNIESEIEMLHEGLYSKKTAMSIF